MAKKSKNKEDRPALISNYISHDEKKSNKSKSSKRKRRIAAMNIASGVIIFINVIIVIIHTVVLEVGSVLFNKKPVAPNDNILDQQYNEIIAFLLFLVHLFALSYGLASIKTKHLGPHVVSIIFSIISVAICGYSAKIIPGKTPLEPLIGYSLILGSGVLYLVIIGLGISRIVLLRKHQWI